MARSWPNTKDQTPYLAIRRCNTRACKGALVIWCMGIRVIRYIRKVEAHAGGRRSQPEGRGREDHSGHQPGLRSGRHRPGAAAGRDPQHSALGWANLDPRPDRQPEVQSVDAGALARRARAAAGEYAWVVIDCPPGISRVNTEAIRAADVVLIPCKPRVWDVWACEDIVDAVKLRQGGNRGWPRAAFVISMERPRTRLSRSIGPALAELGMPVLQGRTTEREAYAVAGGEGGSVLEGRDRSARNEIIAIRGEVEEMCHDLLTKA